MEDLDFSAKKNNFSELGLCFISDLLLTSRPAKQAPIWDLLKQIFNSNFRLS